MPAAYLNDEESFTKFRGANLGYLEEWEQTIPLSFVALDVSASSGNYDAWAWRIVALPHTGGEQGRFKCSLSSLRTSPDVHTSLLGRLFIC